MKLAILGPPGSGKGQNTGRIAERYHLKHTVVGDMVKAELRHKTEVGKIMYEYTSVGRFVPSDIVMQVLNSQLADVSGYDGYVIDTAPINMDQYEKMNTNDLDVAISLEVEDKNILRTRTLNRLICPNCRRVTSVFESPNGVCAHCGSKLEHRYDDNLETVNFRIAQYERETVPVLNAFENEGKLIRINAEGTKEEVFAEICAKIDDFFAKKPLK